MMFAQANSVCTVGQIAFWNWAWVIALFWAWPVSTSRLAMTEAVCSACSAKNTMPTCRMAISSATNTGAISANSTAVAPPLARRRRDKAGAASIRECNPAGGLMARSVHEIRCAGDACLARRAGQLQIHVLVVRVAAVLDVDGLAAGAVAGSRGVHVALECRGLVCDRGRWKVVA